MNTKRILIVDDDASLRKSLSDILRARGYAPIAVARGRTALDRVKQEVPAVALIDLKLVDMSGLEVMGEIKARSPGTECIVLTGHATQASAIEAVNLGAYSFVQKPHDVEQLLVTIRRAVEKREAEEALEALARGTASTTGEAFFPALVENMARALGVRWALVGQLRDGEGERVETLALWDGDHLADNITYDLAGAPCQDVARKGFVIHIEGVQARFPDDALLRQMGAQCYAGAPLRAADGRVVGILAVLDDHPYRVPPGAEEIFRVFAARAAAELERMLKSAALEQAAAEWQRTFDTMSDMVTIHDSDFRIVRANWAVAQAFGYEPEDLVGKQCYQVFHGLDRPVENCPLRRSLQSGEMETLEIWEPTVDKALLIASNPVRDAEGRIMGTVCVMRDVTARKRTEATWQALNAAAVALQRAGLSEAEVYQAATEQLTALGLRGAISLLDETTDSFVFEHFFLPARLLTAFERLTGVKGAGFRFPRERAPVYAQVAESGEAVYIADSTARLVAKLLPQAVSRLAGRLAGVIGRASAILAPLRVEDRVVGVLHVGSDWLTEADVPAITAFADQLSAALENARLYQAALEAAERRNVLHWASQEIVRVAQDPEQVYQAVHQAAAQLMPCEAFIITLLDEPSQELEAVYLVDREGRWPAQRLPARRGLSGQVIASGKTVLIHDFDPASSEINAVHFGGPGHVRSILAVPMQLGQEIMGILSVQSYRPQAYTTDDQHLLEMLAAHAAVALENARLYEAERQRTAELARSNTLITALGHVAARIETAPDPDGVMETLGAELKQLGLTCFVALLEPGDQTLVIQYVSLESAALELIGKLTGLKPRGFRMLRERWPPFSDVVESGRAVFLTDTMSPAIALVPGFARPVVERAIRAAGVTPDTPAILLPLKVEEQIIGVLGMWGEDLQETDLPAASIFASQVASAIERARLYDETRRRAEELGALAHVSSALRTARTVEEMLPILLREATEVIGASSGSIYLVEPESGNLVARCWHPPDPALLGLRHRPGEGITGHVAVTGEVHISEDVTRDPLARILPDEADRLRAVGSSIALPLRTQEHTVGVMHIGLHEQRALTDEEVRLLTAIADMAASAVRRAALFEELEHRVHELSSLFEVGQAITASLRVQDVLDLVVRVAVETVQAEGCYILLWDEDEERLVLPAVEGFSPESVGQVTYRQGEGLSGWVFLEGRLSNVPDLAADPRWKRFPEREAVLPSGRANSALVVPLIVGDKTLGVLGVVNKQQRSRGVGEQGGDKETRGQGEDFLSSLSPPHLVPLSQTAVGFTAADESLLTALAGQVAVAIENARLYEDVRGLSLGAIRSLAAAIDARDAYTRGHSEGVTELTVRLARELGWNGADLEMLEFAALLHDVGKIAVPDGVLRKEGPLSAEEWNLIHLHPYHSAQIVKPVEALYRIVPWIYHHQEKWDGTGYPDGLKGEEIPLAARIIAVADAYNAMTTKRPYRGARSREEAVEELRRCAGTQFDPQVVEAFIRLLEGAEGGANLSPNSDRILTGF